MDGLLGFRDIHELVERDMGTRQCTHRIANALRSLPPTAAFPGRHYYCHDDAGKVADILRQRDLKHQRVRDLKHLKSRGQ